MSESERVLDYFNVTGIRFLPVPQVLCNVMILKMCYREFKLTFTVDTDLSGGMFLLVSEGLRVSQ